MDLPSHYVLYLIYLKLSDILKEEVIYAASIPIEFFFLTHVTHIISSFISSTVFYSAFFFIYYELNFSFNPRFSSLLFIYSFLCRHQWMLIVSLDILNYQVVIEYLFCISCFCRYLREMDHQFTGTWVWCIRDVFIFLQPHCHYH